MSQWVRPLQAVLDRPRMRGGWGRWAQGIAQGLVRMLCGAQPGMLAWITGHVNSLGAHAPGNTLSSDCKPARLGHRLSSILQSPGPGWGSIRPRWHGCSMEHRAIVSLERSTGSVRPTSYTSQTEQHAAQAWPQQ